MPKPAGCCRSLTNRREQDRSSGCRGQPFQHFRPHFSDPNRPITPSSLKAARSRLFQVALRNWTPRLHRKVRTPSEPVVPRHYVKVGACSAPMHRPAVRVEVEVEYEAGLCDGNAGKICLALEASNGGRPRTTTSSAVAFFPLRSPKEWYGCVSVDVADPVHYGRLPWPPDPTSLVALLRFGVAQTSVTS